MLKNKLIVIFSNKDYIMPTQYTDHTVIQQELKNTGLSKPSVPTVLNTQPSPVVLVPTASIAGAIGS